MAVLAVGIAIALFCAWALYVIWNHAPSDQGEVPRPLYTPHKNLGGTVAADLNNGPWRSMHPGSIVGLSDTYHRDRSDASVIMGSAEEGSWLALFKNLGGWVEPCGRNQFHLRLGSFVSNPITKLDLEISLSFQRSNPGCVAAFLTSIMSPYREKTQE